MKITKVLSAFISIALLCGTTTTLAQATSSNSEIGEFNYELFPFEICSSSFNYSEDSTDIVTNFTVKEELRDMTDTFSLTFASLDGTNIFNQTISSDETFSVDCLELNKVYNYCAVFNDLGYMYSGRISTLLDSDGNIATDFDCVETELFSSVQSRNLTSLLLETSGSHSSYRTAQSLSGSGGTTDYSVLQGTISASGQNDWYKITVPSTYTGGRLDVVLGCPSGYNYDIFLYSSNGTTLISSGNTFASGYGEIVTTSITAGSTYYIKVTNHSGSSTSSSQYYYVYPLVTNTKTWYSQYKGKILDYTYWNTYKLDNLYFTSFDSNITFMADDRNDDLMHEGCAISSFAMVLKNLNATTSLKVHDFRTGYHGYVIPDPFTLTLRNVSIYDEPVFSGDKYSYSKSLSSTPVMINSYRKLSAVISEFGYTLNSTTGTISTIKNLLNSHPEGVVVNLKNPQNTGYTEHWLVFCKANNTDGYVVYDPGSGIASKGNGVKFTNSYIYGKGLGLDDIKGIYYLT